MTESPNLHPKHTQALPSGGKQSRLMPSCAAKSASPKSLQSTAHDSTESEAYARLKAQRAQRRKKAIIKRSIIAAVIVGVLGGCVAWYFMMDEKNNAIEDVYITDAVSFGDYSDDINASGSVKPISSVIVTPEVSGTVEAVYVAEGDYVKKGDTLFTIKNNDLDRAVAAAARSISDAERAVNDAQRQLNNAYAAQEKGVDPKEPGTDKDKTEDKIAEEKRQLDDDVYAAEGMLQAAKDSLVVANEAYAEAVKMADARTVVSPIDGTLISFKVIQGSSLADLGSEAGQPLVHIADISKMKVSVQVSELDITKLEIGQEAVATFAAIPGITLKAQIITIASASTSSGDMYGNSNATYTVELVIDAPDERLKSGMTADIVIATDTQKDVLMASPAVLRSDNGTDYYVVREVDPLTHEGERVDVVVMAENGITAALTGELSAGDVLIIAGEQEMIDQQDLSIYESAADDHTHFDAGFGVDENMAVEPDGIAANMQR